jgi:integrase/recombinase XerC
MTEVARDHLAIAAAYSTSLESDASRRKVSRTLDALLHQLAHITGPDVLTGLTREIVIAWRNAALEEPPRGGGLSPATVNVRLSALRGFLRAAVDADAISPERAARLSVPGVRHKPQRLPPLTLDDVGAILRTVRAKGTQARRDGALVALCFLCGLRRAEAAAVTLGRVDLEARVVSVKGKGRKWRTIPLGSLAIELLEAWLVVRRRCPTELQESAPLVLRVRAGGVVQWDAPLTSGGIWQALTALADRAGLGARANPHKLRRTFATLTLKETGGDLLGVQPLLGHASSATTERYDGRGVEAGQLAIAKLDTLVRRVAG